MKQLEAALSGARIPTLAPSALSRSADTYAFFLDMDGTLLEFAPYPDAAAADVDLLELLQTLALQSRGAVALISGRSIASLDALLTPLRLPACGLHGFERRSAAGAHVHGTPPSRRTLDEARRLMAGIAATDPRLVLENKRFAFALHYRRVPQLEDLIVSAVRNIGERVGGGLTMVRGPMVVELSPVGVSKATAIAGFMTERPFHGRRPLYVGDDLTDEPGFEWVNAAGGLSVAVSTERPTAAAMRLQSVGAVRSWLRDMMGQQAGGLA